jgi:hypothetical protein
MPTEIEIMAPFRLPDVRRPAAMPPLPEWCGSRIVAVKREVQPDPQTGGKWRPALTLPASMALSATQVAEIKVHVAELERLLGPTPEDDADAEMLALLTKMMMALPSSRRDELATEASGEALFMAVEDLPVRAVKSAYRRWCRNDVGSDKHGNPFNTRWLPSPAELREVADREIAGIRARICELKMLTTTEALIEYSEEHHVRMRDKLAAIGIGPKRSPLQTV